MIEGVGSDIIEIGRIQELIEEYGDKFLQKILTAKEIAHSSKFKDPSAHLAGRFSAKEAISKALGTGFGEDLDFHDIEIINDEKGKPIVYLSEKANRRFQSPKLLLTISHCKSHAVAFVVLVN